jgi:hypothetical protein
MNTLATVFSADLIPKGVFSNVNFKNRYKTFFWQLSSSLYRLDYWLGEIYDCYSVLKIKVDHSFIEINIFTKKLEIN